MRDDTKDSYQLKEAARATVGARLSQLDKTSMSWNRLSKIRRRCGRYEADQKQKMTERSRSL